MRAERSPTQERARKTVGNLVRTAAVPLALVRQLGVAVARCRGCVLDRGAPPSRPDQTGRGQTGEEAGEVLTVLRDDGGAVVGLDIATFVYRRTPMAD